MRPPGVSAEHARDAALGLGELEVGEDVRDRPPDGAEHATPDAVQNSSSGSPDLPRERHLDLYSPSGMFERECEPP